MNEHEQEKHTPKKKFRVPTSVVLTYFVVVTLLLTGVTLSGYVTSASALDVARVAIMASSATITSGTIPGHPGATVVKKIEISNKQDDTVCEVAQKYEITVRNLTENLPLTFAFFKDEACTVPAELTGSFAAGEAAKTDYYLRIHWPAENNQAKLAFELDAYEVKIIAQQVD